MGSKIVAIAYKHYTASFKHHNIPQLNSNQAWVSSVAVLMHAPFSIHLPPPVAPDAWQNIVWLDQTPTHCDIWMQCRWVGEYKFVYQILDGIINWDGIEDMPAFRYQRELQLDQTERVWSKLHAQRKILIFFCRSSFMQTFPVAGAIYPIKA